MKDATRRGLATALGLLLSAGGGAVALAQDDPLASLPRGDSSDLPVKEVPPDPILNAGVGPSGPLIELVVDSLLALSNIPLFGSVIGDAVLSLAVDPTRIVPRSELGAAQTTEGRPVAITLSATNLDLFSNLWMQFDIVQQPKHGKLARAPGGGAADWIYTPDPGFTGYDRFIFSGSAAVLNIVARSQAPVDIKVTGSYNLFESGPVRPLALSSDGSRLYAVNTPDNRLEVFDVTQTVPRLLNSIPVGLEPVAVALRNDHEAWVVNTLSDNVSVVDLDPAAPYVKRTLQVGDEPQDIVFAGPGRQRAFVTTAHRGQNSPVDPALQTDRLPGPDGKLYKVGRADVWSFDALALDQTVGEAKPLNIVTLFGMPARGLAVSPDGNTVYAAIYKSGNQTTTVGVNSLPNGDPHSTRCGKQGPTTELADSPNQGNLLGLGPCSGIEGNPDPFNQRHRQAPNTSVIVQYLNGHWLDNYGTNWDSFVPYSLPDRDVFAIDANADLPKVLRSYDHVGTQLFNIAVNPSSGQLYVSNFEARNLNRFEGDIRDYYVGSQKVKNDKLTINGRFVYNRITVIDPQSGQVLPRNLNKHLDDSVTIGTPADAAKSLAMPLQMEVDNTGKTLYVAAFGSSEVGVFDVDQLAQDSFVPDAGTHIKLSGGGPSGLVLDPARHRMFVATRFNDGIAVVDTDARKEVATATMYSPEPDYVVKGRRFLYDARYSSSKGDSACASCHAFGDMDGLAWDLGNPQGKWKPNTRGFVNDLTTVGAHPAIHPLKGPMITQSLRGLDLQGPEHWRGDREGNHRTHGESLEHAAFKEFREAFTTLLARGSEPSEDEMNAFADFVMQLRYPPNPIRNLDDTNTPAQAHGEDVFRTDKNTGVASSHDPITGGPTGVTQGLFTCNSCHTFDNGGARFGSLPLMNVESFGGLVSQEMKIPHLRNLYQKVGRFGMASRFYTTGDMGEQVTGFGLIHDGSVDTVEHFLKGGQLFYVKFADMPSLIDWEFTADTGLAPAVGQQVTLSGLNPHAGSRIDLLVQQALLHTHTSSLHRVQCDLVARAHVGGANFGLALQENGLFRQDRPSESDLSDAALRNLAVQPGNAVTYTCAPPGSGTRLGLDRDEDGIPDGADAVTAGIRQASIAPFNPPDTPDEIDQPKDALSHFYLAQLTDMITFTWPNFQDF